MKENRVNIFALVEYGEIDNLAEITIKLKKSIKRKQRISNFIKSEDINIPVIFQLWCKEKLIPTKRITLAR